MKTYTLIEQEGTLIGSQVSETLNGNIGQPQAITPTEMESLRTLLGVEQDEEIALLKKDRKTLQDEVQASGLERTRLAGETELVIEQRRTDLNGAHRRAIERLRAEHAAKVESLQSA
tara:strand:- start:21427 stop:21777 length:351 start_codon:yes stop_codon:yes gene_type:complete